MTMTREDMLRELELLPVWRLRAPPVELEVVKPAVASSEVTIVEAAIVDVPVIASDVKIDEVIVEPAHEPIPVNEAPVALRSLVSEDGNWLFLLEHLSDNSAEETLLQNMLRAIKVKANVDIKNIELAQLDAYQPKVMVIFGDVAVQNLLGNALDFEALRSNQHQQQLAQYNATSVIVTYHPCYLLQHLPSKAKAWDDLRLAIQIVRQT